METAGIITAICIVVSALIWLKLYPRSGGNIPKPISAAEAKAITRRATLNNRKALLKREDMNEILQTIDGLILDAAKAGKTGLYTTDITFPTTIDPLILQDVVTARLRDAGYYATARTSNNELFLAVGWDRWYNFNGN